MTHCNTSAFHIFYSTYCIMCVKLGTKSLYTWMCTRHVYPMAAKPHLVLVYITVKEEASPSFCFPKGKTKKLKKITCLAYLRQFSLIGKFDPIVGRMPTLSESSCGSTSIPCCLRWQQLQVLSRMPLCFVWFFNLTPRTVLALATAQ